MSRFTEELLREAQARAKKLREMRESGLYTEKALEEERKKALLELSSKYERWVEETRKEKEKKLERIKAKYRKSLGIEEQSLNFQRAQAKIKAASTDELLKMADKYVRQGSGLSEDEANLLASELRARGQSRMAEHIRSVSRTESWEEDEEYQKSLLDLKRFNDLYGDTRFVPVELGDAQGVGQGEAVEFHSLERVLDDNDIPIITKQRF